MAGKYTSGQHAGQAFFSRDAGHLSPATMRQKLFFPHRRFASFVHSHAGRLQAKQSRCAGEGTKCRAHHTSIVSATAVVARSAEQKAESAVSIPSVVPASLATAVVEDKDLATRFDSIESALQALSQGQMVVVLDDEKRENEGDLIMAADKACTLWHVPALCSCCSTGWRALCLDIPILRRMQTSVGMSQWLMRNMCLTGHR